MGNASKCMEEKNKIININAIEVIRILIADKKKLFIYSITLGIIGVLLAFGTPKIYKSTVVLAPEESGQGFSAGASSLASMIGMNLRIGQTGDALYPEIYPELMNSTKFLVDLFPIKVTTQKTHESYTYQDYLQYHQKIPIHTYPMAWIGEKINELIGEDKGGVSKKPDPFCLTKEEYGLAMSIGSKINCSVDKKTNVITIVVEDQDPLIAATVADSVQLHLQHAITDYRTKKARVDLEYMDELFAEANDQYTKARKRYASFCDANRNIVLTSVQSKIDDLESDMQLKYSIYSQVVEQRQLAVAKVQERTPAFTIIQGASVPIKHSSRPKVVSLAIWMFFGFMLRCGMLAWRNRKKVISDR